MYYKRQALHALAYLLGLGAMTQAQSVAPLEPDPSGIAKVRFISFVVPADSTSPMAIRIQMISLNRMPPWLCDLCLPFIAFEGQHVWVGPPSEYTESAASGDLFEASMAQCTPHYRDWSTVGLLHVTGVMIVPGSTYRVEQVSVSCEGREEDADCQPGGASVSGQLEIKTTRWGDVEQPYNPPSPTAQPDLADVGALVNKFRNAPEAPIKARALLIGKDGFGTMDIAEEFNFTHIAACVNAFRGQGYPHKIGRCAVGGSPCTINSDCTSAGGAGPCTLYCP